MRCSWVFDAVEKENLSKVASVIVSSGQYFLRIRVKCDDKVSGLLVKSLTCMLISPPSSSHNISLKCRFWLKNTVLASLRYRDSIINT